MVRNSIEFHDSTILSITVGGSSVQINLDAYVHRWDNAGGTWKGTGWIQPVYVVLTETHGAVLTELPVALDGGEIRAGQVQHINVVPLPFRSFEDGSLRLDLVTGKILKFNYRSIELEPRGDGRYLEDLPDTFKPPDLG